MRKKSAESRSENGTNKERSFKKVPRERQDENSEERDETAALFRQIHEMIDSISEVATSESEKWNEREAESALNSLLDRVSDLADRIRSSTSDIELPNPQEELDRALETVRVSMLQAREDIRRRTEAEREYYQRATLLNQAVLQVKSGMKTGEEGREIVREALGNLEAKEVQPCFSRQLILRAERAKREAHDILHSA